MEIIKPKVIDFYTDEAKEISRIIRESGAKTPEEIGILIKECYNIVWHWEYYMSDDYAGIDRMSFVYKQAKEAGDKERLDYIDSFIKEEAEDTDCPFTEEELEFLIKKI